MSLDSTVKTNPVSRNAMPVLGVRPKWGWYVLFFFKIGLCSAISFKRSRRELSVDVAEHRSILKSKGEERILVIFKTYLCSAISLKRSRRELSIDAAEHRSVYLGRKKYYLVFFSHRDQVKTSQNRCFVSPVVDTAMSMESCIRAVESCQGISFNYRARFLFPGQ